MFFIETMTSSTYPLPYSSRLHPLRFVPRCQEAAKNISKLFRFLSHERAVPRCSKGMELNKRSVVYELGKKPNLGSGCDSVGRAVASDTRGPWFEFSHQQKFIIILNICLLSTVY